MDKKYIFMLLVFFVAIIAISGCTGTTKTPAATSTAAFVGGTQGLQISLLPGQPPAQVYSGQDFQITVQIENKGEGNVTPIAVVAGGGGGIMSNKINTITPGGLGIMTAQATADGSFYGYVSLSGINVDSFKTTQVKKITDELLPITKVGQSVVPGGQAQVIFDATAPSFVGAQIPYTLYVTALYGYNSIAVVKDVCIKENVFQQTVSGPEICKIAGLKTVEAAGAPIKVTSVEENPSGFVIKIKNVGGGSPFTVNSTSFQQTESDITFNQKDKVAVSSVTLGNTSITCTPNNIFLVNNEAQFSCSSKDPVTGKNLLSSETAEYTEQLVIYLTYGYAATTSTKLSVLASG